MAHPARRRTDRPPKLRCAGMTSDWEGTACSFNPARKTALLVDRLVDRPNGEIHSDMHGPRLTYGMSFC